MYENEAWARIGLLESRKSASSKIEDYLTELRVQADTYKKVGHNIMHPFLFSIHP